MPFLLLHGGDPLHDPGIRSKICWQMSVLSRPGVHQLASRQMPSSLQIRILQVGLVHVRARQERVPQVSPLEGRARERCLTQVRVLQVGPVQARFKQVRAPQACALQ